jgi:hypothetical protein
MSQSYYNIIASFIMKDDVKIGRYRTVVEYE